MSEIAQYESKDVAVPEQQGDLSALAVWALDARQAYLVAESLARTSFVPSSMKGKPGEITAAILTGQEIGLQPMSALRSIDVIQGTPAMRANALRGLVQSRGHEVWVLEQTETRAVVAGRRKGSEQEQRSVWTIDRAKKLGLTSKTNWQQQPQAMLIARATAECCRLIASDVLLGMPYAVEELDSDAETPDAPKATTRRRTARRAPVEAKPVVADEAPALEPEKPQETATLDPDVYDPAMEPEGWEPKP
jgi:hypothetical protein